MDIKKIIWLVIIILICLGGGFALGLYVKGNHCNLFDCPPCTAVNNETWASARTRLIQSGFNLIDEKQEVKNLNATITSVKGGTVSAKIILFDPLSDPELDIRDIEIGSDTKIWQIVRKGENEIKAEIEAIKKEQGEIATDADGNGPYVDYYTKKEAAASDLKTGQTIQIKAKENIRYSKKFPAQEIIIEYYPEQL